MTIANIRTAYELEYVPVRAKNARLELVSEIVPVEIEEVDELPAAVEVTVKGEVRQVTFVHDGALYAPFDGGTELDELEAKMKLRGRGPQLSRAHWTIRKDLSHLDLKTVCMLSAAPRDDAVIKELRVDGRAGGLAFAQNIADHMLVHRNRVYMRVEAPTVLHVHSTKTGDVSEVKFEPRFKSGAGATQTSLSRAFRPDDADGVNDWVSRNVPGGWDPYVPGDQAYRWTEAGLAAEDMLSWWTIWSARAVFYESAGRDWNLINASGKSLRAAADVKDLIEKTGWFLPRARDAADIASDFAAAYETLADSLEPEGRFSNLVSFLRYVNAERRHTLQLEDAPALAALTF